jgi:hypothetical protein
MANVALDTFVRETLNRGESRERITAALLAAGWTRKEVEDALAGWAPTDLGIAAPRPKPYVSAREAFLYLVLFLLLGVVAWNLGSLLFALIDVAVADVLDTQSRDTQIRGAISGLVVGTPLFAWLGWRIYKQRRANPAMQRSAVRKWLTYVTLVIAACVLVGDAIGIVYNFLSGELSTRLGLKLLVVAAIAGSIFAFFIRDAERGEGDEA